MKAAITMERAAYRPGEEIRGTVSWSGEKAPRQAEVRLFWYTEGKGTRDGVVVETVILENPLVEDSRAYAFRAPDFPYSFSGRLISLIWGVELVFDSGDAPFAELVLAPGGVEIVLPVAKIPEEPVRGRLFFSRFS